MKIGIIVAMDKELNLLLPLLDSPDTLRINGYTFHCGTAHGIDIVAMKCGIGKVNAALGAMTMIDHFAPSLIINTGVAGGTGGDARILDVIIGERIAYHDVWCGPGTEWGDAAGCPRYFTSDASVSALPCLDSASGVKRGLICSGDIFVSRPDDLARIKACFPEVAAVDMESAAIAHTCYMRHIPFFCIRVVSDTPGGEDNIAQYENFWADAPQRTFDILRDILAQISANDIHPQS